MYEAGQGEKVEKLEAGLGHETHFQDLNRVLTECCLTHCSNGIGLAQLQIYQEGYPLK